MDDKVERSHDIPQDLLKPRHFQPNRTKGIIFAFFSLLLLGVMPIISESRPTEFDALTFAFLLSFWELICSLPLLIVEFSTNRLGIFGKAVQKKVRRKTILILIITGIIFSFSTFLYVFSFSKGIVTSSIALQAYPLFSLLGEVIVLKKKSHWSEFLFLVCMLVGLYYIGTEGTWLIKDFSVWFLLALLVPVLWSIAHLTLKISLDTTPVTPNQITFFRVLISSGVLFILASFLNGFSFVQSSFFNGDFQLFAMLMGLAYYLELINWFYCVKHVNVSVASSITTPTPIITTLLTILIFPFSVIQNYQIIGMIIVLGSLLGLIWIGYWFDKKLKSKMLPDKEIIS